MNYKTLDVFYKGEKAGVLSRNKDGFYIFERENNSFPFIETMLSLQKPSRELFSLFETILSQGRRIEALYSKCSSNDPMDLLPFVAEHPVFSFKPSGGKNNGPSTTGKSNSFGERPKKTFPKSAEPSDERACRIGRPARPAPKSPFRLSARPGRVLGQASRPCTEMQGDDRRGTRPVGRLMRTLHALASSRKGRADGVATAKWIPFGTICTGKMDIPGHVVETPEKRLPDELSVFSGMQDKVVVVFFPSGVRLPSRHEFGNAIMKSALAGSVHSRFESFVLNEHLFTSLASEAGLNAAETCLFRSLDIGGSEEKTSDKLFLLSKRFDIDSENRRLLCTEGPAFVEQAVSDREKYTYPVADFFERVSAAAENANAGDGERVASAMAEAVFFSFLAGNSDMHLKNFSFFVGEHGEISFAPLYDVGNSSVYNMMSAALVFEHRDGGVRRPELNTEDGAEAVCDFVWNHISHERMASIANVFGDPFRDMLSKLPFSKMFAGILVEDIERRKAIVENVMRKMSIGVYGER